MDLSNLTFAEHGVLVLRGAFDPTGLADVLWGGLESRHRIRRDDRSTWPVGTFGKLTKFGKSGPFASVATSTIADALTATFDHEWHELERWGQPLITFPTPGPWSVPSTAWHLDFPPTTPLTAIRMFAYLTSVAPKGGGTVVVAGSHRLVQMEGDGTKSATARARLAARSSWFRDLWRPVPDEDRVERFMREGHTLDGVDVRVVELTGEPGDVVLWHPSLLHGVAPNSRDEPRFMLTHTALRGASAGG